MLAAVDSKEILVQDMELYNREKIDASNEFQQQIRPTFVLTFFKFSHRLRAEEILFSRTIFMARQLRIIRMPAPSGK